MSTQLVCDGCKSFLRKANEFLRPGTLELVIQGEVATSTRMAAPFPTSDFHWCEKCARIAFQAVEIARLQR